MALRKDLREIVDALLAKTPRGAAITIDALGEAIGTRVASGDDVDAMMRALEDEGRTIAAPEGQHGVKRLRAVLDAARALRAELGRTPTRDEIAARAGVDADAVSHALELAK